MTILWTDTALDNLQAIHDYIARNSPEYARSLVDRLTRRSEQIAEFPMSGRTVPEYRTPQIREVIEAPYRILYYIKPDRVEILGVVHGALNLNIPGD